MATSSIGSLVEVADRLRAVKAAQRRFLQLWDIERKLINPMIERIASELGMSPGSGQPLDSLHPRRRMDDEP